MFIRRATYNQNIDAVELKYLTAYYLSDCNRDKDAVILLNQSFGDIAQEIEIYFQEHFKKKVPEITLKVCKQFFIAKYFNSVKDADSYNRYLVSYCLNNKKYDLVTGFLDTHLGEKFIEDKIRSEYRGANRLTLDKVNLILQLFREETTKTYSFNFQNKGNVTDYLNNAFNKYFKPNFSSEITTIINTGTMSIGEGKEQKDLNQIKNESIQQVKVSFDIPNFQQLVKNIYYASSVLRYRLVEFIVLDENGNGKINENGELETRDNPLGIIHYDIFSCLKYQMFKDRFNGLKNNPEYNYILSGGSGIKFAMLDINAEGYVPIGDKDSYNYRNYTSRKSLIEVFMDHLNMDSDREFFRVVYSNIENILGKNNTPVFKKLAAHLHDDIYTFRVILKGVKSAKAFIEALLRNGLDPLSIPSEIFKDPAWIQRVNSLEDYLRLYNNVIELEQDDKYIRDTAILKHNKALTRIIADSLKQEIATLNVEDMKVALMSPKSPVNKPLRFEPIGNDYSLYNKYKTECKRINAVTTANYNVLKKFVRVIEYFGHKRTGGKPYLVKIDSNISDEMLQEYYSMYSVAWEAREIYTSLIKNGSYDWNMMKNPDVYGFKSFMGKNVNDFKKEQLDNIFEILKFRALNIVNRFFDDAVYKEALNICKLASDGKFVDWKKINLDVYGLSEYKNKSMQELGVEEFKKFYSALVTRAEDLVKTRSVRVQIEKGILNQKYIDWQPEPEDFSEVLDEICISAKENSNTELLNLLGSVLKIIKHEPYKCDSYYESILNSIRCFSVLSFVNNKMTIIFDSLSQVESNDLVFIDTLRVAKPFIEAIKDKIEFSDLIKFDLYEVAEKFYTLEHKFSRARDDVYWFESTADWMETHPFVYGGKEIQICEPKISHYNDVETARKMRMACDLAYSHLNQHIDFLVSRCLPIIERESIEIYSNALLMGKHRETMKSYASFIRMYPALTEGKIKFGRNFNIAQDDYSLFDNEYLVYLGKLVTVENDGYLYYVHKLGVAVTPELEITDPKCIIPYTFS